MTTSTGTRKERNVQTRANEAITEADKEFIQSLKVFAESSNEVAGLAGASISNSPKTPAGNYLAREGDSMIGPIALGPPVDFRVEIDANETIDIGQFNDDAHYSSNIELDSIQPNGFVLNIIANANFDGQILIMRTFGPDSFTINQGTVGNGGNIQTPDGNDFTLEALQMIILVFDEALVIGTNSGGSWRLFATGSGGGNVGANVFLSNLESPTAINQDLLFGAANFDIGDTTFPADQVFLNTVRLQTGLLTANKPTITSLTGNTVDINFPTGSTFNIHENSVSKHTFSGSSLNSPNIILSDTLTINDSTVDPSFNGQFTRNGNDVKVFSGGSVRNLSDLGGGANVNLSNLSSPTAINQDLLFGATGNNIGDTTNPADQVFLNTVRFQTGLITANKPTISSITGNTVDLNFPTGSSFSIYENAVAKHTFTSSSLTTPNIILSDTLTINDSTTNPSSNGQFTRNGNDVKVFTGGSVVDFSGLLVSPLTADLEGGVNKLVNFSALRFNIPTSNVVVGSTTPYIKFNPDEMVLNVPSGDTIAFTAANVVLATLSAGSGFNINNRKIINLDDPTNDQDAATKIYVDDNSTPDALPLAGGTMSGAINMGTNFITNVIDPVNDQDAATKKYVDDAIAAI